jgi:hypothetical protein
MVVNRILNAGKKYGWPFSEECFQLWRYTRINSLGVSDPPLLGVQKDRGGCRVVQSVRKEDVS